MNFVISVLVVVVSLSASADASDPTATTYVVVDGRTAAVLRGPNQRDGVSRSTRTALPHAQPATAAVFPTTVTATFLSDDGAASPPGSDSNPSVAVTSNQATPGGVQGNSLANTTSAGVTQPAEAVQIDTPVPPITTAAGQPPGDAGDVVALDPTANYGPAVGCVPPTTPEPKPQGVSIKQLAPAGKPNFLIILTDDQGWDDIGLHHPQKPGSRPDYIKTPNLDKFLFTSKQFDNFYVAPMCSQSRAALLTGRDYPRTGTMLVNGGYDYINRGERTSANIMAAGGYKTAHFGKWHNGRTLGYEPWFMGFQESWFPDLYINMDNLMRHNGKYVQTYGLMEQDLMDKMLDYLDQQAANNTQPFYLYYAPNAIHQGFLRPGQGPRWQRPAPQPYLAKYEYLLERNISQSTIEVWAFLEYMDDVLGRLFDYIDSSPLKDNTYVMILSDNGSELFQGEIPHQEVRMPSGMQGYKRAVEEGGIRNYLAIKGPGVQAGVIDSTLLDITDILPTMVDLADIQAPAADEQAFTGVSFKNLLMMGPQPPATARSAQSLATPQQQDRFLFSLSPICWDPDSVPELDKNREAIKPQKLTDYDVGGYNNELYNYFYNDTANSTETGFERCIGVRYQDYKWLGRTNKVYRLVNNSHIELPCNEVSGREGEAVGALMSGAARNWWNSLVASPHSFQKPTFYLGFEGWNVTNILPDGAHDRTPGKVRLLPNGASGFVEPGDRICFAVEVVASGDYEVVPIYASKVSATFKLSVGKFADIEAGATPSLTCQLPALAKMAGQHMGYIHLESSNGQKIDACMVLEENSTPGTPVFTNLGSLRFVKTYPDSVDNPGADEIVYTATNSSTDSNVTESMLDSTAPNQSQGKQEQLNQDSRRDKRQHDAQISIGVPDTHDIKHNSSEVTAAAIAANDDDPNYTGNYSPMAITKAMRQIIPGWSPHNSPSDTTTVEDNPAVAGEALATKTAAAGGRRTGPKAPSASSSAGGKQGLVVTAGIAASKMAASTSSGKPLHSFNLGGKQGITRHRLHKRRTASVATPAKGLDVGGEFKWLVAGPVTNPSSRLRLGKPGPEPEEVVGAMPDTTSTGNNSDSDDNPQPASTASAAGQALAQKADQGSGVNKTYVAATSDQTDTNLMQNGPLGINRQHLKPTPAMQEVEHQALRVTAAARVQERLTGGAKTGSTAEAAWQRLRVRNNWPDGQSTLESMYSPYHAEMIDACQACKPRL